MMSTCKHNGGVIFLCLSVIAAVVAPPANAAIVLDQLNAPVITSVFQARSDDYQGQTFTVGRTGTLYSISVDVADYNVPPVDVMFFLARIVNGTAEFSHSYAITVSSTSISNQGAGQGPAPVDWLSLDFSSFEIGVKPGDQFALVFHSPIPFSQTGGPNAEQINWFAGNPGAYSPGTPIDPGAHLSDTLVQTRSDFDAAFATYISSVPEPSAWYLLILGFSMIGLALSHRLKTGWRKPEMD